MDRPNCPKAYIRNNSKSPVSQTEGIDDKYCSPYSEGSLKNSHSKDLSSKSSRNLHKRRSPNNDDSSSGKYNDRYDKYKRKRYTSSDRHGSYDDKYDRRRCDYYDRNDHYRQNKYVQDRHVRLGRQNRNHRYDANDSRHEVYKRHEKCDKNDRCDRNSGGSKHARNSVTQYGRDHSNSSYTDDKYGHSSKNKSEQYRKNDEITSGKTQSTSSSKSLNVNDSIQAEESGKTSMNKKNESRCIVEGVQKTTQNKYETNIIKTVSSTVTKLVNKTKVDDDLLTKAEIGDMKDAHFSRYGILDNINFEELNQLLRQKEQLKLQLEQFEGSTKKPDIAKVSSDMSEILFDNSDTNKKQKSMAEIEELNKNESMYKLADKIIYPKMNKEQKEDSLKNRSLMKNDNSSVNQSQTSSKFMNKSTNKHSEKECSSSNIVPNPFNSLIMTPSKTSSMMAPPMSKLKIVEDTIPKLITNLTDSHISNNYGHNQLVNEQNITSISHTKQVVETTTNLQIPNKTLESTFNFLKQSNSITNSNYTKTTVNNQNEMLQPMSPLGHPADPRLRNRDPRRLTNRASNNTLIKINAPYAKTTLMQPVAKTYAIQSNQMYNHTNSSFQYLTTSYHGKISQPTPTVPLIQQNIHKNTVPNISTQYMQNINQSNSYLNVGFNANHMLPPSSPNTMAVDDNIQRPYQNKFCNAALNNDNAVRQKYELSRKKNAEYFDSHPNVPRSYADHRRYKEALENQKLNTQKTSQDRENSGVAKFKIPKIINSIANDNFATMSSNSNMVTTSINSTIAPSTTVPTGTTSNVTTKNATTTFSAITTAITTSTTTTHSDSLNINTTAHDRTLSAKHNDQAHCSNSNPSEITNSNVNDIVDINNIFDEFVNQFGKYQSLDNNVNKPQTQELLLCFTKLYSLLVAKIVHLNPAPVETDNSNKLNTDNSTKIQEPTVSGKSVNGTPANDSFTNNVQKLKYAIDAIISVHSSMPNSGTNDKETNKSDSKTAEKSTNLLLEDIINFNCMKNSNDTDSGQLSSKSKNRPTKELPNLHEYIQSTYLGNEVLTASGKRLCTLNINYSDSDVKSTKKKDKEDAVKKTTVDKTLSKANSESKTNKKKDKEDNVRKTNEDKILSTNSETNSSKKKDKESHIKKMNEAKSLSNATSEDKMEHNMIKAPVKPARISIQTRSMSVSVARNIMPPPPPSTQIVQKRSLTYKRRNTTNERLPPLLEPLGVTKTSVTKQTSMRKNVRACSSSASSSSAAAAAASSSRLSSSYYESESETNDSEDVSTDEFESPSKKTAVRGGTKRKFTSDANSDDNVNICKRMYDEKISKIAKVVLENIDFHSINSLIELDKNKAVSQLSNNTLPNNTNETPIVEIKNTNPDIHFHHELYKNECILCKYKDNKSIVAHYVNEHPYNEIYVSRLTSDVADAFLDKQIISTSITKRIKRTYETICPFCKQPKIQNKYGWVHHLTTHTGEFGYVCPKCNTRASKLTHSHRCGIGGNVNRMKKIETGFIKFDGNDVNAFMCKLCNYVQFNKQHVIEHLKFQHELVDDINVNLLEITLIKITSSKSKFDKSEITKLLDPLGSRKQKKTEPTTCSEENSNFATKKSKVLCNNEVDDGKFELDLNEALSTSNSNQLSEPPTDMVDDIALVFKTQFGEIVSDETQSSLSSFIATQTTETTTAMNIICEGNIEDEKELISILETSEDKIQLCDLCFT